MNTRPVLEVIQTPLERTFRVYAHDYPFAYSGWHHHPEYELHLIRRSSGHFYVGTYAGEFGPGNLVMTGPNLPHMWVSGANDRDGDGRIAGRDLVLQLSAGFAERCVAGFSDCAGLAGLLEASRAGIEFSAAASVDAAERMEALLTANGFERMALFFNLLRIFQEDRGSEVAVAQGRGPRMRPAQTARRESWLTSRRISIARICRAARWPALRAWGCRRSRGCSNDTSSVPASNTSTTCGSTRHASF